MITYDEVMPIGTITKARGLRGEMEMEVDYDVFEQGDTSNGKSIAGKTITPLSYNYKM